MTARRRDRGDVIDRSSGLAANRRHQAGLDPGLRKLLLAERVRSQPGQDLTFQPHPAAGPSPPDDDFDTPSSWVDSDENSLPAPRLHARQPRMGTVGKGPGQQHLADGLPYRRSGAEGPGRRARVDPEPRPVLHFPGCPGDPAGRAILGVENRPLSGDVPVYAAPDQDVCGVGMSLNSVNSVAA